ncbi:ankyrin repeat-containing protein bda1 [Fagus crenata]
MRGRVEVVRELIVARPDSTQVVLDGDLASYLSHPLLYPTNSTESSIFSPLPTPAHFCPKSPIPHCPKSPLHHSPKSPLHHGPESPLLHGLESSLVSAPSVEPALNAFAYPTDTSLPINTLSESVMDTSSSIPSASLRKSSRPVKTPSYLQDYHWGEIVLHLCVKYNQLEALKLLVESVSDEGEFLNSKGHEDGNTILHLAVMLKQIEIVKYLLSVSKVKEGVDALNQMGFTALEVLDHSPKDLKNFIIRNILMDAGVERAKNQNNLPPPSIVVVGHHETTKPIRSSNKWWEKWLNYLRYEGNWLEEMRGTLMVVATVITTITFQPIVNPPGGVWQTDVKVDSWEAYVHRGPNWGPNQKITCNAGTSVLACAAHYETYFTFMICNTVSFTASLCVTFLLISGFPLKNKFSLMAVIGLVLLIHTVRFLAWLAMKIRKFTLYVQRC